MVNHDKDKNENNNHTFWYWHWHSLVGIQVINARMENFNTHVESYTSIPAYISAFASPNQENGRTIVNQSPMLK